MSTPVLTSKWAGNFDCEGGCRRKRLMAEEFSSKALDRYRKTGHPLKCKQCVADAEKAERDAAEARRKQKMAASSGNGGGDGKEEAEEVRQCAGSCQKQLQQSSFNRNQWGKGEGKSRCRTCVEQSLEDEKTQQSQSKQGKIDAARAKVENLKQTPGTKPQDIVAAESELAALEAEKVTGLKPIRLGSGRGRGRGRSGGGRGRGRGGK
eukprot:CAMPEP_0113502452 /NCGR_PEP_ID=MMETSP0014_2-20120614/33562_1 /TAXON_ID=2857 /ORGANISM="Nitzschia sp." /LENGTH=207 /DNA_ID=CAMNT_0000397241 /DNA_START=33 /DNA_END=656 /DNA_ORIENTATION=- /assembly_acc=CAM_ASM_000159